MIDPNGDDVGVVDPDLEGQLREHYEAQFRRHGDAPSTHVILARMAPAIAAASSNTRQRRQERWRILPRRLLPARTRVWRSPRLATLGMLAAVAVLVGAATFVAPQLLSVFGGDPGAAAVHKQQLGQAVHLVQTKDGETVTINWVYADANRVLIQYTAQSPSGRQESCDLLSGNDTLTDASGRTYAGLSEPAVPAAVLPSDRQGPSACLRAFDASSVVGAPSVLNLHLAIGPLCVRVPSSTETPPSSAARTRPLPALTIQCRPSAAEKPFAFDLRVPFYGGRVITLNEKAIADGKILTLDRVVVAPSETRLYFAGLDANWVGAAQIAVNGKSPTLAGDPQFIETPRQAGGEATYDVLLPLAGEHGRWVVTLRVLPNLSPTGIDGPAASAVWTFALQL